MHLVHHRSYPFAIFCLSFQTIIKTCVNYFREQRNEYDFKNSTFSFYNHLNYKSNDMQAVNKNQLFLASCIALIFTSLTFAFRASLEGVWGAEFNLTKEQVGWIFSPAFWGFTL